jgi:hypothetical protein
MEWNLTSESNAFSSWDNLTWVTSKNLKAFHCQESAMFWMRKIGTNTDDNAIAQTRQRRAVLISTKIFAFSSE